MVPLLVISGGLFWETSIELNKLKESQVKTTRESLLKNREQELQALVSLAYSAIESTEVDPTKKTERQHIIDVVQGLGFGDGGYFFVNSFDYYAIANGRVEPFEPRPLNFVPGTNGNKHPMEQMVEVARSGGGIVRYQSPKKGMDPDVEYPKMAYAMPIPGQDWLLGTGFYIDEVDNEVAAKRLEFEDTIARIQRNTALILVVLFAMSLGGCAFLLIRSLRPLDNMNTALRDISEGNGDLTKRLALQNDDEIGRCARSFNNFSEKIRGIIALVVDASKDIQLSTNQLDSASNNSLAQVGSQRAQAEQLATATSELLSTAQEITKNCSAASASAEEVSSEANTTFEALSDAVAKLRNLDTEIGQSADSIANLEKESDSIGGVLEVIQQIAEQTNLLALNAAIEAARAGEQGRGFAVVADEVRTLASRTQVSTEEIRENIERLQNSAKSTVSAMNGIRESSSATIEVTEASRHTLSSMTEKVATILDLNTHVATASEEQAYVTDELNRSIHAMLESA